MQRLVELDDTEENEEEELGSAAVRSTEEFNAIRNRLHIRVKGRGEMPNPALTFSDMNLHPDIKVIFSLNTLQCPFILICPPAAYDPKEYRKL